MPRYIILHPVLPESLRNGPFNGPVVDAYLSATMGKPEDAVLQDLYKAFVLVEFDDPETLFAKTQNIDGPWTTISKPLAGSDRQRSTSVGDFIVDVENAGVSYCAPVGWKETTPEVEQEIRNIALTAHSFDMWDS